MGCCPIKKVEVEEIKKLTNDICKICKDYSKNLKDDTKDSTKLNNKLKEIKKSDKICENSDNVYVLIHELNTKINELSQLIE